MDVTERREAEDAIRRSEEEFRSRIEHAPVAIYTAQVESDRIVSANRAMLKLLGLPAETEAAALRVSNLYVDPEARGKILQKLAATGNVIEEEVLWKAPLGRTTPLTVRITERFYSNANGQEFTEGLVSDITQRRILEAQLRQAQKMEAVGQLAGGIAHDFNNMLMIISSYTEMLCEDALPDDKRRGFLKHILEATGKASSLTKQLLAFSRRQTLCPTLLNLSAVLTEQEKMLPRLIGEHIEVVVRPSAAPVTVEADPVQIDQVLMNLAANARDAMPQGGTLTLEASDITFEHPHQETNFAIAAGRYALLSVSDTGCGMDEQVQAHIFEPFYTTKEKGAGTGLGLSMVYGIVKQSGGYVTVTSRKGNGTTFRIYLPYTDKHPAAAREEQRTPKVAAATGNLLLVEDQEPLRMAMKEYLSAKGYKVFDVGTGAEALSMCAKPGAEMDLLVTDVVLPGMQGPELAARVREGHPQTKVLYISGYADSALADQRIHDEGCSFLQKPFGLEALARAIRSLLQEQSPGSSREEHVLAASA